MRRLSLMFLLLILLTAVVFILFNMLPFDPARLTCGKLCTPELLEANRHRLGFDLPLYQQYLNFVGGIFFGRTYAADSPAPIICSAPCLGYSFLQHAEVLDLIKRALPVTFWLAHGRLPPLDLGRRVRRDRGRPPAWPLGGSDPDDGRPVRLLDAVVLHRPRPDLLRGPRVALAAVPEIRVPVRRTRCSSCRR